MFLAGTIQNLRTTPDMEILNFSSLNQRYPRLDLFPPFELGIRSAYEFDLKYAEYLMTNENAFIDFMRIPYTISIGKDLFLLIDDSTEFEMINESLFKFLQQRYGLNPTFITDDEDFMNAEDSYFSALGKLNYVNDRERMTMMLEKSRLLHGGVVGVI